MKLKPETKKKIIIAGITIFVSISVFSILTWPRVSIQKPKGELGPEETIKIEKGPLTKIKSIYVEQNSSPVEDIYVNPEEILKINDYSYDSKYTVYAYVETENPFLKLFNIEAKDIKIIHTWTTPKVESIEKIGLQEKEKVNLTNPEVNVDFFGQEIKVTFSRKMNPKKTSFYVDGKTIFSKWENDNKTAVLGLKVLEEENQSTLEMEGEDFESHPLIKKPSIVVKSWLVGKITDLLLFSGPVVSEELTKEGNKYIIRIPASRYGWTKVKIPAGLYKLTASGRYRWDPTVPEPVIGPEGASWTPENVFGPEEFPLPPAPIMGLLGRIDNYILYLGKNSVICLDKETSLLLGFNERWNAASYNDNNGTVILTLTPINP